MFRLEKSNPEKVAAFRSGTIEKEYEHLWYKSHGDQGLSEREAAQYETLGANPCVLAPDEVCSDDPPGWMDVQLGNPITVEAFPNLS